MNYQEYEKKWEELPRIREVLKTPFSLDIEVTTRCNLNCTHCPFHKKKPMIKRESLDMDLELFRKIIEEGSQKDTKAIKLNFGGEPTLYPHLVEAVRHAKEKGIVEIIINTNAMELTPKLGLELCKAGLTTLIVSDYGIFRQKRNVEAFIPIKKEHGCKLIVNKVKNSKEWAQMNVDKIIPSRFYDFEKMRKDDIISEFQCAYPWQRFIVLVDGNVMSCSCGVMDETKMIGNVNKTSIEALWNGSHMNELRNLHELHESHKIDYCRKCHLRKEYIIKEVLGLYEM